MVITFVLLVKCLGPRILIWVVGGGSCGVDGSLSRSAGASQWCGGDNMASAA